MGLWCDLLSRFGFCRAISKGGGDGAQENRNGTGIAHGSHLLTYKGTVSYCSFRVHPLTEAGSSGNPIMKEVFTWVCSFGDHPVSQDTGAGVVNIRLFGFLRSFMKERGQSDRFDESVPPEGKSGLEVAAQLGLPTDEIEAVFRNGRIQRLDERIYPGDRVAFVPSGTPGPYRVLLGMVDGR